MIGWTVAIHRGPIIDGWHNDESGAVESVRDCVAELFIASRISWEELVAIDSHVTDCVPCGGTVTVKPDGRTIALQIKPTTKEYDNA